MLIVTLFQLFVKMGSQHFSDNTWLNFIRHPFLVILANKELLSKVIEVLNIYQVVPNTQSRT